MLATDLRALPSGGLKLSALGLGCAPLAGLFTAVAAAEARVTIDCAWDLGLRFFDTAPYYGFTLSEHRLGEALRERPRDDYVVSTKAGRLMTPAADVQPGECGWAQPMPFRPVYDYTYAGIMRSHEDSLQRLGMSRVDILFVHDIGRATHGEMHVHYWQQMTAGGGFRALEELRASGQVRAIGIGVNEWEIVCDSMQEIDLDCTLLAGRYTLLEQAALSPFLEECERRGNAIVLGGPFNSGVLAGGRHFDYQEAPRAVLDKVAALETACREFDVPLPAAALQFPMAHPAIISCIPGGRDVAQLRQNKQWLEMPVPAELWTHLKSKGLIDERAPVPQGETSCA